MKNKYIILVYINDLLENFSILWEIEDKFLLMLDKCYAAKYESQFAVGNYWNLYFHYTTTIRK